ncbi:MAG TPA: tetratricopeptide repeat protein [Blastocatellia bacterium]|nr:tetratricopeptide repeat protein [Blastocatellia bacterium]
MRRPRHRWFCVVVSACILLSIVLAQDESRKERPGSASTADEAALRALAQEFYAAYSKEDLDGFLQLWSSKSPELASRRSAMQKLFADHEKIEVKGLAILKMTVEGVKAKLRVEVELNAIEAKSGKPAAGLGKMIRALHGVKEEGAWKVWREASAVEDLADALALLKTDDERSAILTAEKELVTENLVRELTRQGGRLRSQGNYPEALARYRLAQKIAEQIGDQAGVADILIDIGIVYESQSDYARAIEHHQKSLSLSEALGNKAGASRALLNIGIVHYRQGAYAQAIEHYKKSLGLSEALGDKTGVSKALNNIGIVYQDQGDYTQAIEHYKKSLALFETLGDKAGVSSMLHNIGNAHQSQGDYAQALEYYQKSLTMFEALGDKALVSRTLRNIGRVHYNLGDYARELEHYQKSLALSEALKDKVGVNNTLNNIGSIHERRGDYAQALEHYQKSLALSEAMGNKADVSRALLNIGLVHSDQRNYAQALEHYQKSLALSEALGDKAGVSGTLNAMGEIYRLQGDYAQALERYRKSLALSEALGDKAGVSGTLNNIGIIYKRQGDYAQALEHFRKSRTLSEALGDKARVSYALGNIGNVYYSQGDYAQALEHYQKSLTLSKALGSKASISGLLTSIGKSYRALNQLTPARQAFEEAIGVIETLRAQVAGGAQEQQRFFEDKLASYHAMVELLVAQYQSGAALAYAERAKARALLDVLQSGRIDIVKAMTAAEQEREREFNHYLVSLNTQISRESLRPQPDPARLNDLKTQLQKARLDYEAFQTSVYAAHPELKAKRGESEPLTLQQARDLLPDTHTALLEYVVIDEKTYLFTLTLNAAGTAVELKVYPLEIKREELVDRATSFRDTLAKGSPGFRQPARELYDLLLKPAAAQLRGKTSLIIVPDSAFWELPFQALLTAPNRYLIEDCAIAYAPSLSALREMIRLSEGKRDSTRSPTLLAFGNPALGKQTIARARSVLMDEKLDPLPEAERQVNTLKQIYGATKSKIYVGAEAREERAKTEAGAYRILHLATHGILNDSSPMYSRVLMAQAEGDANEDGLLEAWEIMKLDLKADLAVLSACETARGRVGAGEGMIGLSWALFVAGCPTTVASQWKVDSASTTELMLEFHRQLKAQMSGSSNQFSAARALRVAALKLQRSEEYRHPFYWAGFVVAGKGF